MPIPATCDSDPEDQQERRSAIHRGSRCAGRRARRRRTPRLPRRDSVVRRTDAAPGRPSGPRGPGAWTSSAWRSSATIAASSWAARASSAAVSSSGRGSPMPARRPMRPGWPGSVDWPAVRPGAGWVGAVRVGTCCRGRAWPWSGEGLHRRIRFAQRASGHAASGPGPDAEDSTRSRRATSVAWRQGLPARLGPPSPAARPEDPRIDLDALVEPYLAKLVVGLCAVVVLLLVAVFVLARRTRRTDDRLAGPDPRRGGPQPRGRPRRPPRQGLRGRARARRAGGADGGPRGSAASSLPARRARALQPVRGDRRQPELRPRAARREPATAGCSRACTPARGRASTRRPSRPAGRMPRCPRRRPRRSSRRRPDSLGVTAAGDAPDMAPTITDPDPDRSRDAAAHPFAPRAVAARPDPGLARPRPGHGSGDRPVRPRLRAWRRCSAA